MPQFLQELLISQVAARPEHPAICWKEDQIPYGELDRLTNQLAHTLRAHGCRPGDRVSVLMPSSPNAIFAILGILKAGCVAVPIDISVPTQQLAEILIETRPSVILASRTASPILDELFAIHFLGSHAFAAVSIGTLEALPIEGEHFATAISGIDVLHSDAEPLTCRATTNSPAMLFFCNGEMASRVNDISPSVIFEATAVTSATRRPTSVSHAEVLTFLENSHTVLTLKELDRVAGLPLLTPFSVAMAFAALAAGAELHVVPQGLLAHPRQLAAFVRNHELTDWLTTHGSLTELVRNEAIRDGDFPSLKRLFWTGAPLHSAMLRDLMSRLPLAQFARVTGSSNLKLAGQSVKIQNIPNEKPTPVAKPVADALEVIQV